MAFFNRNELKEKSIFCFFNAFFDTLFVCIGSFSLFKPV
jgi:hypothetical protein